MEGRYHVVLVEDDELLKLALKNTLSRYEFNVTTFTNGIGVGKFISEKQDSPFGPVHILVSDVKLPDTTGLAIIQELKNVEPLGKILISNNQEDQDKIDGLIAGADDYLGKPINPQELLLRIRALIKRLQLNSDTQLIDFLHFKLNPENNALLYKDNRVALSYDEIQFLLLLIGKQGKLVTRPKILSVLGKEFGTGRALDMLVSRLRKKMGDTQSDIIITYRGKGYMLALQVYSII